MSLHAVAVQTLVVRSTAFQDRWWQNWSCIFDWCILIHLQIHLFIGALVILAYSSNFRKPYIFSTKGSRSPGDKEGCPAETNLGGPKNPQESWEWRSSFSDIGTTSNGSESRKALLLSTLSSPATSCHTIQVSSKLLPRSHLKAAAKGRNTKQISTDADGDATRASNGEDCSLLKWSATGSLPIIGGPSSEENRRKRGGQVGKSNLVFAKLLYSITFNN